MQHIVVNSFGGCGSKHLTKSISHSTGNNSLEKIHLHERYPNKLKGTGIDKMVFLFSDPYSVVKSFFWRQSVKSEQHGFNSLSGGGSQAWPFQHCKNIEGDFESLDITWTIQEFLENGQDFFKLEEFIDNWLCETLDFPVLFLRYEAMWDHVDDISHFLDIEEPLDLGVKLPRTSEKMSLSDTQIAKFTKIYEGFFQKVSSLENIFYR